MNHKDRQKLETALLMAEQRLRYITSAAMDGCMTDGAHHKQYFLEQIIELAGYDVKEVRAGDWEPGIAP